jgi:hypothetical protein
MNEEKTLKQWFLDLLQKLFDLFKGREDNYADDNELLAGMAENDDEKAAIMQICDEIDETNNALDEVVEAAKEGKDATEWLSDELKEIAGEQGESLTDQDIQDFLEAEAEADAQRVSEQLNYEPKSEEEDNK